MGITPEGDSCIAIALIDDIGQGGIARNNWVLIGYPSFYFAFTHESDPASFTATSEMKMCSGLPSAVPRCSVEISRGPAFL